MFALSFKLFAMLLSLVLYRSATSRVLKDARVASSNRRQTAERLSTIASIKTDNDHRREIGRIILPSDGLSDSFDIVEIMFGMLQRVMGSCGMTTIIDGKESKWPPKYLMDTIEQMLQRCVAKCNDADTDECVKQIMLLIREAIKTRRDVHYVRTRAPATTTTTCTTRPDKRSQCTRIIQFTTPTCRDITTTATFTIPSETCSHRSPLPVTTSSWLKITTTTTTATHNHWSHLPLTTSTCCYTTTVTTTFTAPPDTHSHWSRLPLTTSTCRDTTTTAFAMPSETRYHRLKFPVTTLHHGVASSLPLRPQHSQKHEATDYVFH